MVDILGYEGLYAIDGMGRVYSYKSKKYMGSNKGHPYKSVALSKDGKTKTFRVHRLVAKTFIPNPHNKPQVNHKDGNKLNNEVSNLEWCTSKENNHHAYKKKLSDRMFLSKLNKSRARMVSCYDLDGNLIEVFKNTNEASEKTGTCQRNIVHCCNKAKYRKTANGFRWGWFGENL